MDVVACTMDDVIVPSFFVLGFSRLLASLRKSLDSRNFGDMAYTGTIDGSNDDGKVVNDDDVKSTYPISRVAIGGGEACNVENWA